MGDSQPKRQRSLSSFDLVATTVHELKSPLVLMRGLANMLAEGQFGNLTQEQAKYINKIATTSERLLKLVTNLLVVNQLNHKRLRTATKPTAVNQVIDQVIDELSTQLKSRQVAVIWSRHLKLPPVLADEQLLYRVFYNLVDNTIKYSPPKTTITIRFRTGLRHLAIQIRDQGIGIKKQEIGLLFERFGTVTQPVSAQADSSGLGLFIVKSLVELQGGHVSVSRLRQGSCFTINLPTISQLELFDG